jgi:oligoribonuclease (3'-5' exoribonuclease)
MVAIRLLKYLKRYVKSKISLINNFKLSSDSKFLAVSFNSKLENKNEAHFLLSNSPHSSLVVFFIKLKVI